jgi:hypothetical protein
VERIMPTPYVITFAADIWTTNTDQKLQIFEQLAVLFTPSLELQTTDNYIDWTSLSVLEMSDQGAFSSRQIPQGAEQDIDIMNMIFTSPIWITPPAKVKKLGIITKIISNIFVVPTGTVASLEGGYGDAIFGEPELKFGAGIVTLLLPWVIGPKKAKDIIFTGQDRIDAPSALQMGIISRVVKDGMHLEVARQIARSIALVDPNVVMGTKKAINSTYEIQGIQKALKVALDIDHQIESVGSPDKKAFMDIARERGMREAIAWRDARFAGTTTNE